VPHATKPQGVTPSDPARLGWIDTARGLTMIFVVLLHADVVAQAIGRPSLLITLFNYALYPMRMPMFFLVAGLLSSALLTRSTGEVMRRRVLHYAWLYALWSTIYAVVHAWVLRDLGPPGMQVYYNNIEGPVAALTITWNNTWFLYALGLFYAAALAMRRLPVPAQVAITLAAAAPGLFDLGEAIGLPVLDRFYHFPYFMLGILGGARLRDAIPRLGRWQILALLAVTCLLLAALAHQERILREPAVIAALSVLAMPAELATALLITRQAWQVAQQPRGLCAAHHHAAGAAGADAARAAAAPADPPAHPPRDCAGDPDRPAAAAPPALPLRPPRRDAACEGAAGRRLC